MAELNCVAPETSPDFATELLPVDVLEALCLLVNTCKGNSMEQNSPCFEPTLRFSWRKAQSGKLHA